MGRYFLFKKSLSGRFPEKEDITDHLICLSMIYGDSKKLAIDQKLAKESIIDLPRAAPFSHAHPCDGPDSDHVRKQRDLKAEKEMRGGGAMVENDMKCTNWGCSSNYQADRNDKKVCKYHSGKFEFGSEHGLWAEGWTCCRGSWDS